VSRKSPARKSGPPTRPSPLKLRSRDLWICAALLIAIFAVYAQAGSHDFVDYDDRVYVGDNPHVRDGFTWDNVAWAFTSIDDSNWFPLTRLSHILDCQLFGLDAGMQHWTNIVLHAISTLLLFALLKRMTAARWPSAFVAFAFALHPLHVESVAWIAERKDVFSALFWFVTIWTYLNYVDRPTLVRYLIVIAAFLGGLMSKPMIVTLPFVLLLLDHWPLGRLKTARVIWEKAPLIALSMAASLVTFIAQKQGRSVQALTRFPIPLRIENAIVSYVAYLGKFFWPAKLAIFYPYPDAFPAWQWILAALALAAITALAIVERIRRPYLITGWLWYLGTLVPVIGLVQVGAQTRADRYTYIPMVGISIMIAWLTMETVRNRRALACAGAALAVLWCALTWRTLEYWQNSETLFLHAIDVTEKNFVAYNNLGGVRRREGRFAEAVADFENSVQIQPENPEAQDNLGEALTTMGRVDEAIPHLEKALQLQPDYAKAHIDLGSALMRGGRTQDAVAQFAETLRLDPENREAEYRLGGVLASEGRSAEALPHFERALPYLIDQVKRNPDDPDDHYNLGGVFGMMGRADDAIREFTAVVRLRPDDPEAHFNLGLALSQRNHPDLAAEQFSAASHLRPDYARAHFELARSLAAMGRRPEAAAEYSQTLQLAPDFVQAKQELLKLQTGQ
jgi:protein O-mannosyl-transferase